MTALADLKRSSAKARRSALEETLAMQIRAAGLAGGMERELCPVQGRRWRVDFAWPARRLVVEVEGGIWTGGRHSRGAGFESDVEKYGRLTADGWTVLRVTAHVIRSGQALQWIEQILGAKQ